MYGAFGCGALVWFAHRLSIEGAGAVEGSCFQRMLGRLLWASWASWAGFCCVAVLSFVGVVLLTQFFGL